MALTLVNDNKCGYHCLGRHIDPIHLDIPLGYLCFSRFTFVEMYDRGYQLLGCTKLNGEVFCKP
jgi:hypothetical protein